MLYVPKLVCLEIELNTALGDGLIVTWGKCSSSGGCFSLLGICSHLSPLDRWFIARGSTIPDDSHFLKVYISRYCWRIRNVKQGFNESRPKDTTFLIAEVHRSVRTQALGDFFSRQWPDLNAVDCLQKPRGRWILNIPVSLLICSVSSLSRTLRQQTPFSVIFSTDAVNTEASSVAKEQTRKGVQILLVKTNLVHNFFLLSNSFQCSTVKNMKANIIKSYWYINTKE